MEKTERPHVINDNHLNSRYQIKVRPLIQTTELIKTAKLRSPIGE